MLSKATWLAEPPKSTERAVPLKATPIGTNGLKLPVGSGAPFDGVVGKAIVARTLPVALGPS